MRWSYYWLCYFLICGICYAGPSNIKYDIYFYKWNKTYFGESIDWKWWKSQGMVESNLNPNAISPVGAKGIMQFMPGTWEEVKHKMSFNKPPTDPYWNIAAAIYYNKYLWNNWKSDRTKEDRLSYVFASYNGGLGNVLKAQRLCIKAKENDCNTWNAIERHAHNVITWKCEESLNYVKRIFKTKEKLK